MDTLTSEPRYGAADPADVHLYRCREYGIFRLSKDGLTAEMEPR
jgi:hypothetical protein